MASNIPEDLQKKIENKVSELITTNTVQRIWDIDHTVWKPEPTEIANRLGWLFCPGNMVEKINGIEEFVAGVRSDGFKQVVLLGMGGSSLAPEVFRKIFGVADGYLELSVLDSTDPGAVLNCEQGIELSETIFIVATKSGGTVETLSGFKYFYNKVLQQFGAEETGKRFVAITDPGSSLQQTADELSFRQCFLNDPDIGGRFAALSYFGLVPAALIGVDLHQLLQRSADMAKKCRAQDSSNPGAWLGVLLAIAAADGMDKVTFIASDRINSFGAWTEQLIAESTGKENKGILPVHGETPGPPSVYADDRLFVYSKLADDDTLNAEISSLVNAGFPFVELQLKDEYDIGAEYFRWEFATAVAGVCMQINPFDQPNVESAKKAARAVVAEFQEKGTLPEQSPVFEEGNVAVYGDMDAASLTEAMQLLLSNARLEGNPRSYVALQAFLTPDRDTDAALERLRSQFRDRYQLAVTVGYGPRFLHSTGQLHKGDAGYGIFIQFTSDSGPDVDIPDNPGDETSSMTFGVLKHAQALGDNQALVDERRQVMRCHFTGDVNRGIEQLLHSLV